MTLVLLILAVIWAAVLIPPFLRARAEGRPADSITDFHRQLSVLRRTGPRVGGQPDWASESPYASRHISNLATERELKVRLLPTARRHEARLEAEGRWVDGDGGWLAEPTLLRQSAT
ncbi:MAG TPA: hypothetical protein VM390_02875 [Acidimicrobiales bacterium]|nr:hypothetical protein [Acidimicrobiales bacterium]